MKIAVAMSGGVDSSAAAAILKEQGHELVGFTMQLWNQRRGISVDENGEPLPSRCCSLDDVYDARRVAEELGFPFYVLNLEKEFERDVVQPFVNSYLNGETPIPCVACNSRLKFASLDKLATSVGCEKVATGHYARVEFDEATNRYRLLRGRDPQKDQSYFLWELTQGQLSRALFPLGELSAEHDDSVIALRWCDRFGLESTAVQWLRAELGQHRITVGCDKAYDTQDFVADVRGLGATPHVTQNDTGRRSAIDGRTTRHWGYQVSLLVRKRIEEVFGWMKTIGGQRKTRYRGTPRVGWMFTLSAAAYDLIRLPKLLGGAA